MTHLIEASELVDIYNNPNTQLQYASQEPHITQYIQPTFDTHTQYINTNSAASKYIANEDILAEGKSNHISPHHVDSSNNNSDLYGISNDNSNYNASANDSELTGIDWFIWQYSNWERIHHHTTLPSSIHTQNNNTVHVIKYRVINTSAYIAAKLLQSADYIGNKFVDLFGLTNSRYQYVLDAYQKYQRELNEPGGMNGNAIQLNSMDELAIRESNNMELGQVLALTSNMQPPTAYAEHVSSHHQQQSMNNITNYNNTIQIHPALAPVQLVHTVSTIQQPNTDDTPVVTQKINNTAPVMNTSNPPPNPFQQHTSKTNLSISQHQSNTQYIG